MAKTIGAGASAMEVVLTLSLKPQEIGNGLLKTEEDGKCCIVGHLLVACGYAPEELIGKHLPSDLRSVPEQLSWLRGLRGENSLDAIRLTDLNDSDNFQHLLLDAADDETKRQALEELGEMQEILKRHDVVLIVEGIG